MTTIKAAILYILQLKRVLREEAAITEEKGEEKVEEREEAERKEVEDEQELPSFQLSAELEKLPPMAVLKPPQDIQYLQQVLHFHKMYYSTYVLLSYSQEYAFQKYTVQESTTMHCCVKSEGCEDENEDFLLLEEGGVIRSS